MKKKGKGKPRGMNYADLLKARRDRLQLAMDEAALLNVEQSMQRYLWLMAVSLHDAYGFGPERLQKFFEAFQENSDELAKMRAEVDDDYAFEKLRLRAEELQPLLRETRELAVLTARYYDRSYHKHEKYTL